MGVTRHDEAVEGQRYRYAVDGWGVGEILVRDGASSTTRSRRGTADAPPVEGAPWGSEHP